jgi:hypothetical protein
METKWLAHRAFSLLTDPRALYHHRQLLAFYYAVRPGSFLEVLIALPYSTKGIPLV